MTLKMKLLLFIGLGLFAAIGVSTVILERDLEQDFRKSIEWRSASLAQGLRSDISDRYSIYGELGDLPLILEASYMLVKTLFDANQNLQDVSYVSVIDEAGIILAHNERSMLKSSLNDPSLLDALSTKKLITVADQTDYHTFIPIFTASGEYLASIGIGFPTSIVNERMWQLFFKSASLFVVVFSFVFSVVWVFISRFVTTPIKQLVEATTAISEGDLTQEIEVLGTAEFRDLSVALTQMQYSINVNITALAEKNRELNEEAIKRNYSEEERFKLEQKLRQSQKMEAVGQLTGGISHDFNNILAVILGNLELIEDEVSNDEVTSKFVAEALRGVDRGAEITRKLLNYSRSHTGEERLASINDVLDEMGSLISKSLTVSINVKFELAENIWPVKVNVGDLQDVLLNLSLNAGDAMFDGGSLFIETSNKTLDEDYALQNPDAKVGEYIMISVSDTGAGMTPEARERALEPFFTTKPEGKGTGLGLSMVYGFIKRSRGHIKIYSEIGKGTTVRLYLPRAYGSVAIESEELRQVSPPRGNEMILVVDDEDALVQSASANLASLGYGVCTAVTGKQALKLLSDNKEINLLFTDIVMPEGMDGYQLAMTAHEMLPSLKILVTSGFTKEREAHVNGKEKYLSDLVSNLLDKPYNKMELAIAVRKALDGEANFSKN